MSELVRLEHISKNYGKKPVLKDISISFSEGGGTLVVGQTGSGKTTMAQILCGGIAPDSGNVLFEGKPLAPSFKGRDFKTLAKIQYIFQDPYGAVDPGQTVLQTLSEPVRICRRNHRDFVDPEEALKMVDASLLPFLGKRTGVLSGGQLQKICVARALIPKPKILITDEATAMLDREGAKELFRLLHRIRKERGIALISIVHDIDFSDTSWDRIAVFCDGEIVEQMDFREFTRRAGHPYSRKLIESYEFFATQVSIY